MKRRIVLYTTAVAAAAALAGCAETSPDEDSYGSLATAITATGTDGATYRMPAGTYVQAWSGTFSDWWSMDGDFQILTIEVPVGDYQVALGHASGYTVEWPLERTNPDATTETVNATLVTVQPVAVTVNEGATSSLVFQFQVVDGGTVTFAHGLIDISIDVDVTTSTVGRATYSATYNKDSEDLGPTAPPELGDMVPAVGSAVFHQISVNVVGDWVQNTSNSACSTATLIGGTVSASYVEITREAWLGGTARLCVYGGIYAPYVFVESWRAGPAITATFQALPADELYVYQTMSTILPDPIFDGTNLDLGAMTGTFTLSGSMYTYLYGLPPGGSSFEYWYGDFNSSAAQTFTFVPTL
ncbi:MAG TPA: hypothetical protein VFU21_11780 [Kofleriaceae bacterium]|nr:hypothetical protein [Kofleriaceae bacterium]